MDTYYLMESSEELMLGIYIGYDPNLKYQKCFILDENNESDKYRVRFVNDYIGRLEVNLSRKDILLA